MSKLRIVFNSLDFPVSYSCQGRLTTEKGVSESEVKFLYDLAFPSSMNAETARAEIESNLLKQVATAYELFNGMACDGEPTGGGLWLLKASSDPQDAPNPFFDSCYTLVPNATETCISYQGVMTVAVVGSDDTSDIIDLIAKEVLNGTISADTAMRVSFLGTQIDAASYKGGRDNLAPAVNAQVSQNVSSNSSWTPIGILLVLCITLAFIGLVMVLIARKRRKATQSEIIAIEMDDDRQEGDEIHFDGQLK